MCHGGVSVIQVPHGQSHLQHGHGQITLALPLHLLLETFDFQPGFSAHVFAQVLAENWLEPQMCYAKHVSNTTWGSDLSTLRPH